MIIREELSIAAPLETVWEIFSDIAHWDQWNPVCRECRWEEGSSLESGASLSFELQPLVFPIRIAPVVTRCRPLRLFDAGIIEGAGSCAEVNLMDRDL